MNNTFAENEALSQLPASGYGGAVLARGSAQSAFIYPILVNNIFCNNLANGLNNGNSVYPYGSLFVAGTLLYNGAFSDISDSASYHYSSLTPGLGCFFGLLHGWDPPLFVGLNDYHLNTTSPVYSPSPIDAGHAHGASPYDLVPADDLDGLPRQSSPPDMGCYETQE